MRLEGYQTKSGVSPYYLNYELRIPNYELNFRVKDEI